MITRLIHRVYTVFNAKQIDGIPEYQPKRPTPFEVVNSAEQILDNSGAKITHDQADHAFYNRASDSIHLPPKDAFKDAAGYYGTALHELAHWTGHPSRLDRPTLNASYRFGDTNYAKEELRAELASVFLAAERGIPHDPEQHAAYVGSWIKTLRQDKNEIFRAAHDASAATDYLLRWSATVHEQMNLLLPVPRLIRPAPEPQVWRNRRKNWNAIAKMNWKRIAHSTRTAPRIPRRLPFPFENRAMISLGGNPAAGLFRWRTSRPARSSTAR